MMELVFIDKKTREVNYAVTEVERIRWITPSEVGFTCKGRVRSASFPHNEVLEIHHLPWNPNQA